LCFLRSFIGAVASDGRLEGITSEAGAVLGIFIWVGQSKGQANFG